MRLDKHLMHLRSCQFPLEIRQLFLVSDGSLIEQMAVLLQCSQSLKLSKKVN